MFFLTTAGSVAWNSQVEPQRAADDGTLRQARLDPCPSRRVQRRFDAVLVLGAQLDAPDPGLLADAEQDVQVHFRPTDPCRSPSPA